MTRRFSLLVVATLIVLLTGAAGSASAQILPTDYPKMKMSLQSSPRGAPNVVVVLLDDVGFAAASTFGGPIDTPSLQQLANEGLRYNRFHTTAICSPTRAALLTGRNPHAVGVGAVLNTPSAYPGYNGLLPKSAATIAEILRQNGYGTAAFGKWHLAPEWESSPAGPYDHWPVRQGFDHFYGFLPAEVDQFAPTLVQDQTFITRPRRAGYHLTEDLADQAIAWIQRHRSATPDRPFFAYFAPGAAHAPLQAPKAWIERYKGRFAQGWDRLREESFARQKSLGVIPADAVLTPRPEALPAWDSLTRDQRKLAERYMETYAGFLAHTDAQVGRLRSAIEQMGELDNTLFIYIVGDNGSSGEAGPMGSIRYMSSIQGVPETTADMLAHFDDIGGPKVHAHYNAGWAWALNAPFPWMKQIASHLGGIRNPLVISWPSRIKDRGGLRDQFAFVADLAPTILAAAGVEAPATVNGVAQQPIDGLSLLSTFDDAKAPSPRRTQYFNVYGNRAIYHDGWLASAFRGRAPWDVRKPISRSVLEDRWELFNLANDFSQSRDLAKEQPAKLAELQALFWHEAGRNQVLPLIDNGQTAGLPVLFGGRKRVTLYAGSRGIPEMQSPPVVVSSHTLTARIDLPRKSRGGTVVAYGGIAGGWALHVDTNRRPVYSYNFVNAQTFRMVGDQPLPVGKSKITLDLDYDKPMSGGPATAIMKVNGRETGRMRIERTVPFLFSIHETLDVGIDLGGPVTDGYTAETEFDGQVRDVVIDMR
ncbi:MAG: arylsulfatase [Gammaproteobacteria bacterium]|nr:arylsulfatase [Gammaproteobacteria bacterium]